MRGFSIPGPTTAPLRVLHHQRATHRSRSDELDDLLDEVETLYAEPAADGTEVRLYVAVDSDTLRGSNSAQPLTALVGGRLSDAACPPAAWPSGQERRDEPRQSSGQQADEHPSPASLRAGDDAGHQQQPDHERPDDQAGSGGHHRAAHGEEHVTERMQRGGPLQARAANGVSPQLRGASAYLKKQVTVR